MDKISVIFFLILASTVNSQAWAGVPFFGSRSNLPEERNTTQPDNKTPIPPAPVKENNGTANATQHKLPDKFHPENARDVLPMPRTMTSGLVTSLSTFRNFAEPLLDMLNYIENNKQGKNAVRRGLLDGIAAWLPKSEMKIAQQALAGLTPDQLVHFLTEAIMKAFVNTWVKKFVDSISFLFQA